MFCARRYLKLRYLVDRGCKFIGHGLKKDFRIINIYVPPEQILDTVDIYYLKRQRKLALRFLSACLLDVDIQKETHCSIEDAKTALALYERACELKRTGLFQKTLHEVYSLGRHHQWQIPTAGMSLAARLREGTSVDHSVPVVAAENTERPKARK